jgi:hypothetical protein
MFGSNGLVLLIKTSEIKGYFDWRGKASKASLEGSTRGQIIEKSQSFSVAVLLNQHDFV